MCNVQLISTKHLFFILIDMTTTKTTISIENKLTPKMMEIFAEEFNETSVNIREYPVVELVRSEINE